MTRFMISLDDAVNLVWHAFGDMHGGEIYVKKIPSMKIIDIASVINPTAQIKTIGIRPGEKIHEQMIGQEDDRFAFDFGDHFRIYPAAIYGMDRYEGHGGAAVEPGFSYSSDQNEEWMSQEELKSWLNQFRLE